jgi:hypothetical protein
MSHHLTLRPPRAYVHFQSTRNRARRQRKPEALIQPGT